jgi:hypothetical protein
MSARPPHPSPTPDRPPFRAFRGMVHRGLFLRLRVSVTPVRKSYSKRAWGQTDLSVAELAEQKIAGRASATPVLKPGSASLRVFAGVTRRTPQGWTGIHRPFPSATRRPAVRMRGVKPQARGFAPSPRDEFALSRKKGVAPRNAPTHAPGRTTKTRPAVAAPNLVRIRPVRKSATTGIPDPRSPSYFPHLKTARCRLGFRVARELRRARWPGCDPRRADHRPPRRSITHSGRSRSGGAARRCECGWPCSRPSPPAR